MKSIEWQELPDAAVKALDDFVKVPERWCHNFLVRIRTRYENDPAWVYSRELLLFDGFDSCGNLKYVWLRDWYEGQNEVEYLAVADLDEEKEEDKEEDDA